VAQIRRLSNNTVLLRKREEKTIEHRTQERPQGKKKKPSSISSPKESRGWPKRKGDMNAAETKKPGWTGELIL